MPAKPSPAEHVASPASPTPSVASSGRASFQSHARTISSATEPTMGHSRTNRFSLSFPVQPSVTGSPTRASQSPARDTTPALNGQSTATSGPTDTNFLTAIAAQERRVLELKEELQKAEVNLGKLKEQWARHEANKKRDDARRVTKLQPVHTALPIPAGREEDADGSNVWMQQEMQRRKALISCGRSSSRTVFSGSRHTRTLSLLSPGSNDTHRAAAQQLPPRKDSLSTTIERSLDMSKPPLSRPYPLSRASTTPDLTTEVAETVEPDQTLPDNLDVASIDREALLRTGKKIATDFKDGLWTFWDDLRQATVGEEANGNTTVQPPLRRQSTQQTMRIARKQASKNSLRPSSRGSSVSARSNETRRPSPQACKKHAKSATLVALPDLADPSFWTDQGVHNPQQATPIKKSPTVRGHKKDVSKSASTQSSEEAWDAWDDSSPNKDSRSSSAASESNTAATTVSGPASPRQSVDKRTSAERKDPLPWPALSKLGPATLRRTASHLMNEWEKSLTPSPGQEFRGEEDYLGLGAEAAATAGVGRKQD